MSLGRMAAFPGAIDWRTPLGILGLSMKRFLAALGLLLAAAPALADTTIKGPVTFSGSYPTTGARVKSPIASITDYAGADATGATSSNTAFVSCITSGKDCFIPEGTFQIACADHNATAGITIFGIDRIKSILKLPNACARGTAPLIQGANFRNLTVDVNNATAAANSTILGVSDNSNTSPFVENVGVINATVKMFLVVVGGISADTVNPIIRHNYLAFTAPNTDIMRCVLFTHSGGGAISGGFITDNVCVNAGMGIDASNLTIARNDISGWAYSGAIQSEQSATTHHLQIIDNRMHDSATTLDIDSTASVGIENWAADSTIIGNKCWNTGGECLSQGGQRNLVSGNWAYGTNKHVTTNDGAFASRYDGATYNGNDSYFVSNKAQDDGSGLQHFGYLEQAGGLSGIIVASNDFNGNGTGNVSKAVDSDTQIDPISMGLRVGSALIANASAAASASLEFPNITTAGGVGYNSFKLVCHGMLLTAGAGPDYGLQVGVGVTPTWKTTGSYAATLSGLNAGSSTLVTRNTTTENYMPLNVTGLLAAASVLAELSAEFGQLDRTNYKMFRLNTAYPPASGTAEAANGTGLWIGTNEAITSIRVIPATTGVGTPSGTIADGTCSLYGLTQ